MSADTHRTGTEEAHIALPAEAMSALDRAWSRCIALGIAPGQRIQFEQVGAAALDELDERHAEFLGCAHPHLQWMSRGIAETGGIVVLTNVRGTVLRRYGRIDLAPKEIAIASRVGISLDERCVGSSAPSIAMAEGAPSVVTGSQHFCGSLRNFHCVAAPIENLSGELLGAVDLTTCGRAFAFDALALVVDVVRTIENGMFQPTEGLALAMFHVHPGLVESNSACLLLIDEAWTIRAANRAARLMLGREVSKLLGRSFGEMLDARHGLSRPGSTEMAQWLTPSGLQVYGRLRWGAGPQAAWATRPDGSGSPPTTTVNQAAAPPTDLLNLHDIQARSIELALQRTRGNVAKAAQLLGISRQTLYRRTRR